MVNAGYVNAIRDAGYEFHVWTVNDVDDAAYFQQLGVDSITTDRPGLIRRKLNLPTESHELEAAGSNP
ncbi:MAG: glycerophosphodiester phosphodiesterase family protein [Planctomycetota bacterium]